MSSYDHHLPDVFPFLLYETVYVVERLIGKLVATREGVSNGSSFAVTSDHHVQGMRKLWLSEASYNSLPIEYQNQCVLSTGQYE